MWGFVRNVLLEHEEPPLRPGPRHRTGPRRERGDPEVDARHWLVKPSETDKGRRGFLRSRPGRMTDPKLDEELVQLEATRRVAEREL